MIEDTKLDWRELGFHYDRNDEKKEWVLSGSKTGLMKFSQNLKLYSQNEKNNQISEHDHLGPYWYLKIMTSDEPGIDKDSIHGFLVDIARLSELNSKGALV
jgi:hypothetical protein